MSAKPSFEEKLSALKDVVEKLEAGETSLEQALKEYQTGQSLLKECQAELSKAEMDVQKVLDASGKAEPF